MYKRYRQRLKERQKDRKGQFMDKENINTNSLEISIKIP